MKFEDLKKCLKENELMKNQNVIDICASFSSRHNHLKYKIEGNSAIYEDGTIIKFILNDDNEIEYYIINNQGDMSNVYPIYNHKLLDLTESENYVINYETGNKESTDGMWIFEYYSKLKDAKKVKEAHIKAGYKSFIQYVPQEYAIWVSWEPILKESEINFSNMTPEEIDEYYSDEYYKKTQEATDPEEKFENACYTAASQWMSGIDEDTDEEFIRTMIVPIAKNAYNNPDKTDEDYFNKIVSELQNDRGIKFNFNK